MSKVLDESLLTEISQFIYREARLQDTHQYDEWEALWTDDGVYWVPADGATGGDPDTNMSIIYDNRSRIGLRVRQFHTGKRYTQIPQSRLVRVVSNIEIIEQTDAEVRVTCTAIVYESTRRGEVIWPSRNEYLLRQVDGVWKMALKKVALAHNDKALLTMSFLI